MQATYLVSSDRGLKFFLDIVYNQRRLKLFSFEKT